MTAFDDPAALPARGSTVAPTLRGVQYAVVPGYRPLVLDLTLPPVATGAVPVVVCLHGGGWQSGSHEATPDQYLDFPLVWNAFLDAGLAVASVQYRLSLEAPFPAPLHDVSAAIRWLRRFGADVGVDPERIGVWGDSAGGHLACLAAMNTGDPALEGAIGVTQTDATVQAAVAWYPPTDLTTMGERVEVAGSAEAWLLGGLPPRENPDAARRASAVSHASARCAPLLLVHGDADTAVPVAQSRSLHRLLTAAGASSLLDEIPGAEHCFVGHDLAPIAARSARFLAERLA